MRHTFRDHKNKTTMQQKLFHFFLPKEPGAFGNDVEKEPQKPRSKWKKYVYYKFALPTIQENW